MRHFVAGKIPRRTMYSILERSGHFPAQRANRSGKIGKKMKEKASYQT